MYDMVTLGGKDNTLEPGNHFATSMSSALGLRSFDPKINREHLRPMGSPYVQYGDSRWKG